MTILFISPILTSFVNGHDLLIYLLVLYTFIIALLITFRNLCHEWTNWPSKIPTVKEKDIITWYLSTIENDEKDATQTDEATVVVRARLALRLAVERYNTGWTFGPFARSKEDPFVRKMAIGHPFAMWILKKESGEEELPDMYSTTWFVQLGLALANQRQIVRALKEHSPFITYRYSKYDVSSVLFDIRISGSDRLPAWSKRRPLSWSTYGSLGSACDERPQPSGPRLRKLSSALRHLLWTFVFPWCSCGC